MSASDDGGAPNGGGPAPGTEPLRAPVVALLVLLVALGATAAVLRMTSSAGPDAADVDLSVPDWRATPAEEAALGEVAKARLAHLPGDLTDPPVAALLDAFAAFNAAHKRHNGRRESEGLRDAYAEAEQRAVEVARYKGLEAYLALGEYVAQRYFEALDAGDVAAMERWGGTYLADCRATSLVIGERRLARGARPVMHAGLLATWVGFVGSIKPGDALLAPEERLLLARFKLGGNPLVSSARRAELAVELERLGSDYPVTEARAARAASERDWAEAARLYARASRARPGDAHLAANAAFCEARAQQADAQRR